MLEPQTLHFLSGSKAPGDEVFNALFHPVAIRLIDHIDAVLRIGGASAGADEMLRIGKEKGKCIFYDKVEIPAVEKGNAS